MLSFWQAVVSVDTPLLRVDPASSLLHGGPPLMRVTDRVLLSNVDETTRRFVAHDVPLKSLANERAFAGCA